MNITKQLLAQKGS